MPSEASLQRGSVTALLEVLPANGRVQCQCFLSTHDRSMTDSSSAPDLNVSSVSSEGADDVEAVAATRGGGGASSTIDLRLPVVVVPAADTGLVQTVGGAVNAVEDFDAGLGE